MGILESNKKLSRPFLLLFILILMLAATTARHLIQSVRAFGGLTDEAVTVWQHRDVLSPTGYDIWYSWLGRPFTGAATSTLAWHASGGPVPQAAPIAKLTGDDKNAHVSINGTVAVAVWQHASGEGASPGQWDIVGARWNSSTTSWDLVPAITYDSALPSTQQDDLDPTVAVDSNGNAIVVWVFRLGVNDPLGHRELAYAVLTGTTWTVGHFTINAGGRASLPEVTITSVPSSSGGPLAHKAVCIWSDVGFDTLPIDMRPHKMWYVVLDNDNLTTTSPTANQIGTEAPPAILDVGYANYTATDLDPFGASQRVGLTADASNHAYAMWGGSRPALAEGVVGAILDVTNPNPATNWSPMLTTTGSRFLGVAPSESPDNALTTPTGDLIGVFNALGNIEHTIRLTSGAFEEGTFSYSSELFDERPSNAGLSAKEMVAVNWGGPVGPTSDMIFSIGTVNPGTSIVWSMGEHLVPGGLPGDDMFPEVASGFASPPLSAPSLSLSPATATNPVGSPHTVTATVTENGPKAGVTVNFPVSGSATPSSGACITGTSGQCTFTFTDSVAETVTITATATVSGQLLTATAKKTFVAPTVKTGFMTGGAVFDDSINPIVNYGFELHCDPSLGPNNLEVNFKGSDGKEHKFHLENVTSASCSDDPTIDPGQPPADFDTLEGSGTGRFDGNSGAVASYKLQDAGEPGAGKDFVKLVITSGGLSIEGKIKRGNHQAHNKDH